MYILQRLQALIDDTYYETEAVGCEFSKEEFLNELESILTEYVDK